MPLTRGKVIGYDAGRMMFEFTMLTSDAMIECEISSVAMDDLAGKKGTLPPERDAQFLSLRDKIERLASDHFDDESEEQGPVVRIFAKHIPRQ